MIWAWLWACGVEPNDRCRLTPERCQGGPGGYCASEEDCATDVCCEEEACAGGMCTFSCGDDADCPSPMRCHDEHCFYDCASELDCGPDMRCHEGVCLHGEDKPGKGRD